MVSKDQFDFAKPEFLAPPENAEPGLNVSNANLQNMRNQLLPLVSSFYDERLGLQNALLGKDRIT